MLQPLLIVFALFALHSADTGSQDLPTLAVIDFDFDPNGIQISENFLNQIIGATIC